MALLAAAGHSAGRLSRLCFLDSQVAAAFVRPTARSLVRPSTTDHRSVKARASECRVGTHDSGLGADHEVVSVESK